MEYYEIDQEFPYTLYVAEESSMPTIRIAIDRNAYFNFEGAATVFDKRQMFMLADFIRNVAENMETYDEQDPPF
jgi:hypothetical protein